MYENKLIAFLFNSSQLIFIFTSQYLLEVLTMEDFTLSLFLFIVIYSSLCWLYSGCKQRDEESIQDNFKAPDKPIEQQLKEIWDEGIKPVENVSFSKPETVAKVQKETQEAPTVKQELPEEIEVKNLSAIAARKIASKLQIQQIKDKKRRSKASLIKDIEKELKANPIKIAPIIVESMT